MPSLCCRAQTLTVSHSYFNHSAEKFSYFIILIYCGFLKKDIFTLLHLTLKKSHLIYFDLWTPWKSFRMSADDWNAVAKWLRNWTVCLICLQNRVEVCVCSWTLQHQTRGLITLWAAAGAPRWPQRENIMADINSLSLTWTRTHGLHQTSQAFSPIFLQTKRLLSEASQEGIR